MKIFLPLIVSLSLITAKSFVFAQSVPIPDTYPPNGAIAPWGHTNLGTSWNTSDYLPLIYNKTQFRLMLPADGNITYDPSTNSFQVADPSIKYPLILFFHGIGEAGSDNNNQLKHGGQIHRNANFSGNYNDGHGFFALYPQSTSEYIGASVHINSRAIINILTNSANVDVNRIVIHGLSAGALATWTFLFENPTLVAAAAPMSGIKPLHTITNQDILNTVHVPIWISQGGLDTNPTPVASGKMRDMYLDEGGFARYSLYPNGGHGIWNNTYNNADFFPFLMRADKRNIHVFNGGDRKPTDPVEICPGVSVNIKLGLTPGFSAYQWRKNGVDIVGATGHNYTATDYGSYQARFRRGSVWEEWSIPVNIIEKDLSSVPGIETVGLSTIHLPGLDGSSSVELKVEDDEGQYFEYKWSRVGTSSILGTSATFEASNAGEYLVAVKDISGCFSNYSNPFKVVVGQGSGIPDAPSNLVATALSETETEIYWDQNPNPVNNEDKFEVYRSTTSGGPFKLIAILNANANSYVDSGLESNVQYFYLVRGVNSQGGSVPTNETNTKTLVDIQPPTAPSGLEVVKTTESSVTLAWHDSDDNVGVYKYDVYKDGEKTLVTSETSIVVNFLDPAKIYHFTVKARDLAGNVSVASQQVTAATINNGLSYQYYEGEWDNLPNFSALSPVSMGAVDNFTLEPRLRDDNYAFVFEGKINCPSNGTYTFYTSSDDGSKLYINGSQVVNNDGLHGSQERSGQRSLSAGKHNIRVEFFERTGGEALSVSWRGPGFSKRQIPNSAFQDDYVMPTPPQAPSNLTASAISHDQINLSWSDNSSDESGFEIFRSVSSGDPFGIVATVAANASAYQDKGLDPATTYYYLIRSIGETGESGFNDDVNKGLTYEYYQISGMNAVPDFNNYTPVKTGITDNFNLSLRQRNDDFAFRFTGSISLPAEGDYTFYTSSDDGSMLYINGQLVVNNDGLHGTQERSGTVHLPAGSHQIVVSFFEKGGGEVLTVSYAGPGISKKPIPTSALKEDEINATTHSLPSVPAAPANLQAVAEANGKILLSWVDKSDNEQVFEVFRSAVNNSDYRNVAVIPASAGVDSTLSFVNDQLFPNTEYFYKVRAKGVGGFSEFTQEISLLTLNSAPVLTASDTLAMLRYDEQKALSFTATDADGDPITFHSVNLPAFATLTYDSEGSAEITITPNINVQGVYENIEVYAQDNHSGIGSVTLSIVVNDNYSPQFPAFQNYAVDEGDSLVIDLAASDQNAEDVLTYHLVDDTRFVSVVNLGGNEGKLVVKPSYSDAGAHQVKIRVKDNSEASDETVLNIQVNNVITNYLAQINFGDNTSSSPGWNNTNKIPAAGDAFALIDSAGNATGATMHLLNAWGPQYSGIGSAGAVTGNNSGVFPDDVMKTYYFTNDNNDRTIRFSGLKPNWKYTFTFFPSRDGTGVRMTNYTIGTETVSLNSMGNTSATVQIVGVSADANGEVSVLVRKQPTSTYGYLNAMTINAYFDDGNPPAAPTNLQAAANSSSSVSLSWSDQAYNETAFEIYRSTNEVSGFALVGQTGPDVVSYEDTDNLQGSSTYYYKARAVNAHGASDYSAVASALTLNSPPLFVPVDDVVVNVGEILQVNIVANDPENDPISLSAQNLPSFASFTDNGNGAGVITFSPVEGDAGIYSGIQVTASNDPEMTSVLTFKATVVDNDKQTVLLNFTNANNTAPQPWNNMTGFNAGNQILNLKDEVGESTGIGLTVLTKWPGVNDLGMTGGVYPDEVTKTAFWFSSGNYDLRVFGLDQNEVYDFTFFNSRSGSGDRNTVYTIGAKSVTLNASNNLQEVAKINNVTVNETGELVINVAKTASASYGYLNALIIESRPVEGEIDYGPGDLKASALSTSSIRLQWVDNSDTETGFEVFRSEFNEGPFSLVATTNANAVQYVDQNLTEAKTYYYYVRAKYPDNSYSNPSNSIGASTYLFSVLLNFNVDNPAASPWNNTNIGPENGMVFSSLRDSKNRTTSISVKIVDENPAYDPTFFGFSGDNPLGMITGNNSGIVPDNVMRSTYWLDPGRVAELKVSNLDLLLDYNFEFFASRDGSGNRTTNYTVDGKTTSLNAAYNTSNTAQVESIKPDEEGEALISMTSAPNSSFAYIGALMIHGYRNVDISNPEQAARLAASIADEFNSRQPATASSLNVYPNPFENRFTVGGFDREEAVSIIVRNYTGQIVYRKNNLHAGGEYVIELDGSFQNGLYLLEVYSASQKQVFKVMKE